MYTRVKQCIGSGAIKKLYVRSCSTVPCHVEGNKPKPFEDIPGPRSLPLIGTLYKYLPFIGKNSVIMMIGLQISKIKFATEVQSSYTFPIFFFHFH